MCPVDFSEASRGALRYATALSEHFYAALTVLTVDDPLLADAAMLLRGAEWLRGQSEHDLENFVKDTLGPRPRSLAELRLVVTSGKPAPQILRTALEHHSDAIVMSSHGTTGPAKLLFGSTTDRVLRETSTPVLVIPAADPGPENLEEVKETVRTILMPVDLTSATSLQVRIARGLAEALGSSLVVVHVFEPERLRPMHQSVVEPLRLAQRQEIERGLTELMATLPTIVRPELVVADGRSAEEITRIGPRMGSVTSQVLSHCSSLIVALPPAVDKMTSRRLAFAASVGAVCAEGLRIGRELKNEPGSRPHVADGVVKCGRRGHESQGAYDDGSSDVRA